MGRGGMGLGSFVHIVQHLTTTQPALVVLWQADHDVATLTPTHEAG